MKSQLICSMRWFIPYAMVMLHYRESSLRFTCALESFSQSKKLLVTPRAQRAFKPFGGRVLSHSPPLLSAATGTQL